MSRELTREVFERGHAVAVLPFDPARRQVVLIEQFRVGALGVVDDPWLLEPVAGIIESGESAPEVARREAPRRPASSSSTWSRPAPTSPARAAAPRPARCSSAGSMPRAPAASTAWPTRARTSRCTSSRSTARSRLLGGDRIHAATTVIALQWLALHRANSRSAGASWDARLSAAAAGTSLARAISPVAGLVGSGACVRFSGTMDCRFALFALFLASIVGQVFAGWYALGKSWRSRATRRRIFALTF